MPIPPHGIIEIAIQPRSEADREKLSAALGKMVANGLLYGVDIDVGAPQVAYRETIGCRVRIDQTYKRQTGRAGEFARVVITFNPAERGSGFQFNSACDPVPLDFISGVISGLEGSAQNGLLAGFPLTDVQATLVDLAYHDHDSSKAAFEVAAREAVRQLRQKGAPELLEPIMNVEVLTPREYVGDVIGDLKSRRGQIQRAESQGDIQMVTALAPLANMFGYARQLSAVSRGLASYTMQYDHYDLAPGPPEPPDDLFPTAVGMRA